MIEHLDRPSAQAFLDEAFRILKPEGILRLVVPDLAMLVDRYKLTGDADELVAGSLLASEHPKALLGKARYLILGSRHHAWMYDAASLGRLVKRAGFAHVTRMSPGQTMIVDPGALNLRERADESLFIEASKTAGPHAQAEWRPTSDR